MKLTGLHIYTEVKLQEDSLETGRRLAGMKDKRENRE